MAKGYNCPVPREEPFTCMVVLGSNEADPTNPGFVTRPFGGFDSIRLFRTFQELLPHLGEISLLHCESCE